MDIAAYGDGCVDGNDIAFFASNGIDDGRSRHVAVDAQSGDSVQRGRAPIISSESLQS